MKLVVDASTLVAELMRERGKALFQRPELQLLVSEHAWTEAERGLQRRMDILRKRLPDKDVAALFDGAFAVTRNQFEIVPADVYAEHETVARSRVRDETDWPTVALALATEAAILTGAPDFLVVASRHGRTRRCMRS